MNHEIFFLFRFLFFWNSGVTFSILIQNSNLWMIFPFLYLLYERHRNLIILKKVPLFFFLSSQRKSITDDVHFSICHRHFERYICIFCHKWNRLMAVFVLSVIVSVKQMLREMRRAQFEIICHLFYLYVSGDLKDIKLSNNVWLQLRILSCVHSYKPELEWYRSCVLAINFDSSQKHFFHHLLTPLLFIPVWW